MSKNKSLEQAIEDYTRKIRNTRGKILEDFYIAYAAYLSHLGKDFLLDDICLVEQECENLDRKFWFEFRPKFEDKDVD